MNREEKWLFDEKYRGEKCKAFFTDLGLLKSGTPLAYLIGSIPFLSCKIYLDSHPLIPRPETEFWTLKAITTIKNRKCRCSTPTLMVLDLCAGSGAIGVAVAKAVPEAQVDFAEIDPFHLITIQKNIATNLPQTSSRFRLKPTIPYRVFETDLFKSASRNLELGVYDFIVTNPPYIDPEIDRAEESVKLYEPSIALYGGNEGMEYIQKIIQQAPGYLSLQGQLWIEHEPEQSIHIVQLAKKYGFLCSTHKDQYSIERYSILVLQ